jgi:hypothetical protein
MYSYCDSSSLREDCKSGHNLIANRILRVGTFEALGLAEGILMFSWREIERGPAYLLCLHTREKF